MGDNKNFVLFAVISLAILLGFNFFYLGPKQAEYERQLQLQQEEEALNTAPDAPAEPMVATTPGQPTQSGEATSAAAYEDAGFVRIETPELTGSLSLRGARFDDLTLINHKISMDDGSESIHLLKRYGTADAYYVSFNWHVPKGAKGTAPDESSAWTADSDTLAPGKPVTLSWDNGDGARYMMKIEVDERFMFTVTQSVINSSGQSLVLAAGGEVRRSGTPETDGMMILHEGMIGMFGGLLQESKYDALKDDGNFIGEAKEGPLKGGWMGITDKFWMTTLIPDNDTVQQRARLTYSGKSGDSYGADYAQEWRSVAPGETIETTNRFYAGAKIVGDLDRYEAQYQITYFSKAIDWGWLWFFTQPIFIGLHWLFEVTGNYGVAILLMTVILKLGLFPLANKSYRSMAHMKKAQPKIKALQERYKDDKQKQQQEMMALYKAEKINPMAGCLPMIPQMFIFFALYKTLYVTIEMRHQPFMGWITDLSAADPLTPLNLFGLIPWDPPSMIAVGVLPILMGLSMWLQQKLNPQQASMDPAQQKIMNMLPLIFTFIMAQFSAGLVLYWTWNNILSIAQQWVIMRREDAAMAAEGK